MWKYWSNLEYDKNANEPKDIGCNLNDDASGKKTGAVNGGAAYHQHAYHSQNEYRCAHELVYASV